MYAVFRTHKFDRELEKFLSASEQREVEKIEKKQLTYNPFVGDPLGYRFFREKKIGGKRIYYIVYEELQAVLMVAVSDKKAQQQTINEIKDNLKEYYLVVREALRQHGESFPA